MLRPNTLGLTGLLGLLVAFGPVATDMYVPSMPEIGQQLAASTPQVQLTLSSYLVGFAAGQIVYGPLSDHWGRKPVLLMALTLFCAASLACALAPTIEILVAARAFQALGGAGAIVLPRAIVRDIYAGERAGRELSRIGAVMSFAPVIAPLLGAAVQVVFGWRANFIVIVGIGLTAAVLAQRALPETLVHRSTQPLAFATIVRGYGGLITNRAFLSHLSIAALGYAGLFAWISGSPFVLQNLYGLSAFGFGAAFAAACLGSLASATIAASLVIKFGLDRTIGIGTLALATGGLAMVASVSLGLEPVASLVLSMVIYHSGLMLAMPQAIAGAMTPFPNCAGTASSLIGLVQQFAAALLGAAVGYMLGKTAWPLVGAIATVGCLSHVLWAISRRARNASPHPIMMSQAIMVDD